MNPWKIIGWIILVLLVLSLTFCGMVCMRVADQSGTTAPISASATPTAPAVQHTVRIVSVECQDNYGRNRADVTIENTGSSSIPYAKAFVQFTDAKGKVLSAQDSYFRPSTVPPGATASATVYSSGGGAEKCGLATVQDGDGVSATIK